MDAKDRLFADIALRLQLLSREQVATCKDALERSGTSGMGDIAVELGLITQDEAALVRTQAERLHQRIAAQRAPVASMHVAEERIARADPRSASSPPAAQPVQARAARPVAPPLAARPRPEAAAPADAPAKARRRGPQTWDAPVQPEQNLIRIPQADPPTEPIDFQPIAVEAPGPRAFAATMQGPAAAGNARPGSSAALRQASMPLDGFPMAEGEDAAHIADAPEPPPPPPAPQPAVAVAPAPQAAVPAHTLIQPFAAPQPARPAPAPVPASEPPARGPSKPPPRAPEVRPAATVAKEHSYLGKALALAVRLGASDLHVHSGSPLLVRVDGQLRPLSGNAPISPEAAEHVIAEIATDDQWSRLSQKGEVDFACEIPRLGRFRVNVYRQQRGLDAVFRIIPLRPPTLEQLGLPARLSRLTDHRTGMVLCTGPAGCGKSSTLAALINQLVQTRADHILTVEDPVEFVFTDGKALVNQRQIRDHTSSFARALRAALREDPDIIAITELRDRDTMSLAISAAETGHLVLGTLHTGNAAQTIHRIVSSFDESEQEQIRVMLSESLRAVVSQRLVPMASGKGRAPALEILMVTPAVSNLIREDKTHQLPSVMQTGKALGMLTLDDSLAELIAAGKITPEAARRFAVKKERFA